MPDSEMRNICYVVMITFDTYDCFEESIDSIYFNSIDAEKRKKLIYKLYEEPLIFPLSNYTQYEYEEYLLNSLTIESTDKDYKLYSDWYTKEKKRQAFNF